MGLVAFDVHGGAGSSLFRELREGKVITPLPVRAYPKLEHASRFALAMNCTIWRSMSTSAASRPVRSMP